MAKRLNTKKPYLATPGKKSNIIPLRERAILAKSMMQLPPQGLPPPGGSHTP